LTPIEGRKEHDMTLEETIETAKQNKGNKRIPEGESTRAVEQVTAKAPSQVWLWMAGAAISGSLALFLTGRRQAGIFVGLWPLTFLVIGNYNKLVKSMGSS
jgi:hypothetical protein